MTGIVVCCPFPSCEEITKSLLPCAILFSLNIFKIIAGENLIKKKAPNNNASILRVGLYIFWLIYLDTIMDPFGSHYLKRIIKENHNNCIIGIFPNLNPPFHNLVASLSENQVRKIF